MLIIREVPIGTLVPYDNNPRHNDEAVEFVANSIKEFGFKVPIVIDRNNVIVTGHTRLKAAKLLGLKKLPCIVADDLTDEQVKAFRLVDNKVAEMATWDEELLDKELKELLPELDMSAFSFKGEIKLPELSGGDSEEDQAGEYEDPDYEEKRALKEKNILNLAYAQYEGVGEFDIPEIRPVYEMPEVDEWIGFNYVLSEAHPENKGVHFFVDDYQFERVWNSPEKYCDILSRFKVVLAPDFSPYGDMPLATQIFNHYRKHWCAAYWQDRGLTVIPTIRASEDPRSFSFYLDGEPMNGIVAYSSMWTSDIEDINRREYKKMVSTLHPKKIIVYGDIMPWMNTREIEHMRIQTFAEGRWG